MIGIHNLLIFQGKYKFKSSELKHQNFVANILKAVLHKFLTFI